MGRKITLRKFPAKNVQMFKITNRRGYAAISQRNLTEGTSPIQAYQRMAKALKRLGLGLEPITSDKAKKLVKK